ncbi:MAG: hypothetical protein V4772_05030 [Pseudomonadota bacterium]
MLKPEKTERMLLAFVLALLAAAIFGPFVAQSAHHHDFADRRVWGSIPFAMDVLSNLPFALWGALGLACILSLFRQKPVFTTQLALAALFFLGLLVTMAASSWYHWSPNDSGLAFDRLGMTLAFAGLLGLAAAGCISSRAGLSLAAGVLVFGTVSIWVWASNGNVLPWALLQFGGMAMVLWFAFVKALPGALAVRWGVVIAIYALAKLLELADHQIYDLTSHLVSGHSLKHVVASFAAWPVLAALRVWVPGHQRSALHSQDFSAECLSSLQQGQPRLFVRKLKSNPKRSQA